MKYLKQVSVVLFFVAISSFANAFSLEEMTEGDVYIHCESLGNGLDDTSIDGINYSFYLNKNSANDKEFGFLTVQRFEGKKYVPFQDWNLTNSDVQNGLFQMNSAVIQINTESKKNSFPVSFDATITVDGVKQNETVYCTPVGDSGGQ